MPEQEVTNSAKTKQPLGERAREVEEKWRAKYGLSKGLYRRGNAIARDRRLRAECPKEPKATVRHRRFRKKQLGKFGAASTVRLVDVGNAGDEGTREGS
jgi:hypothetical protein